MQPNEGRADDSRSLSALWRQAGRRLREDRDRLCRLMRRARLDARADRPAPRRSKGKRRTHLLFERVRFDPLRSRRADAAAGGRGKTRVARATGEGPCTCHAGDILGRYGGEPDGDYEGRGHQSPDHQHTAQSVRPDAGFRRSRSAIGHDPDPRKGTRQMGRPLRYGTDQHEERTPHQLPARSSLRRRFSL